MNAITTEDCLQICYKERVAGRRGHRLTPSNMHGVATVASMLFSTFAESAKQILAPQVKNIVLVHSAYGDASSWGKVNKTLQADGHNATAVQIPLPPLPVMSRRRQCPLQRP